MRQRKFGRKRDQRRALLRSLAEGLFKEGKIETTEARAKELKKFAERLITLGRPAGLPARRLLIRRLGTAVRAAAALKAAVRYQGRPGGYTRVVKLPRRASDGSARAIIELV